MEEVCKVSASKLPFEVGGDSSIPLISRLRPRRNRKNKDSRLLEQYILPKQQDSVVILEKLNLEESKRVPVYKAMETSEKSLENKNDVYDFKFDINDTREKTTKKKQRKRNVNKGKGKINKKTTVKKTVKKVTTRRKASEVVTLEPDVNLSVEIAQNNLPSEFAMAIESKEDIARKMGTSKKDTDIQILKESVNKDIEEEIEPSRINTDCIQTVEKLSENIEIVEKSKADINVEAVKETTLPDKTIEEQIRNKNISKPRILSIKNANNIVVTKSPSYNTSEDSSFQTKNLFDNKISLKEHSTAKCPLLTKTLSPILKTINNFDSGSPWRPPTVMFSQTKHFIQSTPYKSFETHKENMEIDKENMTDMNKDMNKENKGRRERKKKKICLHEKHVIKKKLQSSENQALEKGQVVSKSIVQPAPARISLGEIKNLQRPNVSGDNKQGIDQIHTEVDESLVQQENTLVDFHNFFDTFDVLAESERPSNIENDAPLFMDLEPSHFPEPAQRSYRRKRALKFDFSEDSSEENVKSHTKKRISKKEQAELNKWIKETNANFQEIENSELMIEYI